MAEAAAICAEALIGSVGIEVCATVLAEAFPSCQIDQIRGVGAVHISFNGWRPTRSDGRFAELKLLKCQMCAGVRPRRPGQKVVVGIR